MIKKNTAKNVKNSKWNRWFQILADNLGVEERVLIGKLKDFRASQKVSDLLRKTYPTERAIDGYPASHPPRHKTIDLILSFLDAEFSGVETEFASFAAPEIANAKNKHKLSITRTFDAEEFRRPSYWEKLKNLTDTNIRGFYILHRCNSDNRYRKELVYISLDNNFNQSLNIFWYRKIYDKYHTYVGNLYIGEDFHMGTMIQNSSDRLMRPINIAILNDDDIEKEFTFTGTITGIAHDKSTIFHYPIALERARKLDTDIVKMNAKTFTGFAKARCESLEQIETNPGLEEMLQDRHEMPAGAIGRALRKAMN